MEGTLWSFCCLPYFIRLPSGANVSESMISTWSLFAGFIFSLWCGKKFDTLDNSISIFFRDKKAEDTFSLKSCLIFNALKISFTVKYVIFLVVKNTFLLHQFNVEKVECICWMIHSINRYNQQGFAMHFLQSHHLFK